MIAQFLLALALGTVCKCPAEGQEDAGSQPIMVLSSEDLPRVAVCASEVEHAGATLVATAESGGVSIYTCEGHLLASCGWPTDCIIERKGSSVSLTRAGSWPFGPSWSWTTAPSRRVVVTASDPPTVFQCTALRPPHLADAAITDTLAWYHRAAAKTEWSAEEAHAMEDLVGRLLAIALNHNQAARDALLEPAANIPGDGYLGFVWKAAQEDLTDYETLPPCDEHGEEERGASRQ